MELHAGDGKQEVDHVGGIAKVSIEKAVASGLSFSNSEEMVDYLDNKFKDSASPTYYIKDIDARKLDKLRARARANKYETLQRSNKFQVIVFRSNSGNLRAAPRLCLCEQCNVNYGDCHLFSDFQLSVIELNKKNLQHGNKEERDHSSLNNLNNFIIENTFVAVAADELPPDSNWFMKVVQRKCVQNVQRKCYR